VVGEVIVKQTIKIIQELMLWRLKTLEIRNLVLIKPNNRCYLRNLTKISRLLTF
jgi:hypothetical protein